MMRKSNSGLAGSVDPRREGNWKVTIRGVDQAGNKTVYQARNKTGNKARNKTVYQARNKTGNKARNKTVYQVRNKAAYQVRNRASDRESDRAPDRTEVRAIALMEGITVRIRRVLM
jgi:hypothetical protein